MEPTETTGEGPGRTHGKLSEFTLVMDFKPGGADQLRRLIKERADEINAGFDLMGTIHNARIVIFDNDKRAILASAFDGSWDAYTQDFAVRVPEMFDALFGVFEGYPGVQNVEAFRDWTRKVQVTADIWWGAYPEETASDVRRAIKVTNLFDQTLDVAQT